MADNYCRNNSENSTNKAANQRNDKLENKNGASNKKNQSAKNIKNCD